MVVINLPVPVSGDHANRIQRIELQLAENADSPKIRLTIK